MFYIEPSQPPGLEISLELDPSKLRSFITANFQLIPLHVWDASDNRGRERGKSPRDTDWTRRAYDNAEVLTWMEEDGGNIGVRLTATQVVLDYDPRSVDPDLFDTPRDALDEMAFEYGLDLDSAPCVITGSGGRHYYFTLPDDTRVRNGVPEYRGIEFKSVGRQVVGPGSRHPNGTLYVWDPLTAPLSELPALSASLVKALRKPKHAPVGDSVDTRLSENDLGRLLRQLDAVEFNEHDSWFSLMQACHYASGGSEEGREIFVAWSAEDASYADDSDLIRSRWATLDPDPGAGAVTTGTLYHYVIEAGGSPVHSAADDFDVIETPKGRYLPKFDRDKFGFITKTFLNVVEAVKGLGVNPAYDEFSDLIVLKGSLGVIRTLYPDQDAVWGDALLHTIRRTITEEYDIDPSLDKTKEACVALALEKRFNPIEDWLRALGWDGIPRVDKWAHTHIGAADNDYTSAVGRLLLTGAVARALVPGIKFDTMVVLEGPQGSFKSSLLGVLGGKYTLEGLPNKSIGDRDVVASMIGRWYVEIAELANMRAADVESMKMFMSTTKDRARLAYAHTMQDYPRRCIIVGTTNDNTYLVDTTGNRRYLPLRIGRILLDLVIQDRDQLFAEALHLWEEDPTPEALVLPKSLWSAAAKEQDARLSIDPWEIVIEELIDKAYADETRIATQSLLWDACHRTPSNATRGDVIRVGQIMRKLGWERKKFRLPPTFPKPVWGYVKLVTD